MTTLTHKEYNVIGVGLADVESMLCWDLDDEDKEIRTEAERLYQFAGELSDGDWDYIAGYICDWLWDGDAYFDALRCALNNMLKEKHNAA